MGIRTDILEEPNSDNWEVFCDWCRTLFEYKNLLRNENGHAICPKCGRNPIVSPDRWSGKVLECPFCHNWFEKNELEEFDGLTKNQVINCKCPHCSQIMWLKSDSNFSFKSKEDFEKSNPNRFDFNWNPYTTKFTIALVGTFIFLMSVFGGFTRVATYEEAKEIYPDLIKNAQVSYTQYYQEVTYRIGSVSKTEVISADQLEDFLHSNNFDWFRLGDLTSRKVTNVVQERTGNIGWNQSEKSWCFGVKDNLLEQEFNYECYKIRKNIFTGSVTTKKIGFDVMRNSKFKIEWK